MKVILVVYWNLEDLHIHVVKAENAEALPKEDAWIVVDQFSVADFDTVGEFYVWAHEHNVEVVDEIMEISY